MSRKTIAAIVLAFMLAAAMAAVLNRNAVAVGAQTATLTQVKGKVAVLPAGETEWKVVSERMQVNAGDKLRTGAESSVIVKLSDGSMIKVGPLSSLSVDNIIGTDKKTDTSINIETGKAWARVRKLDGESSFNVKTPTAIAGVRGTFFSSETDEQGSVFDVFDGEVAVGSTGDPSRTVSVKASQRSAVAAGKSPTAPSAIPAGEEEAGRNGFTEQEFTNATFDIQVSINPQVVQPGEKAQVSVQVFKNGAPYHQEVNLRLSLAGSALFEKNGSNAMDVTTDSKGAATLAITDAVEESVTVNATMVVKVTK